VAPHSEPTVTRSGGGHMRDIDPEPGLRLPDPRIHPRMAGGLAAAIPTDVSAYIAGGDPCQPAAGDEDVRLVLADALAMGERGSGGVLDAGGSFLIPHPFPDCCGKPVQPVAQRTIA